MAPNCIHSKHANAWAKLAPEYFRTYPVHFAPLATRDCQMLRYKFLFNLTLGLKFCIKLYIITFNRIIVTMPIKSHFNYKILEFWKSDLNRVKFGICIQEKRGYRSRLSSPVFLLLIVWMYQVKSLKTIKNIRMGLVRWIFLDMKDFLINFWSWNPCKVWGENQVYRLVISLYTYVHILVSKY